MFFDVKKLWPNIRVLLIISFIFFGFFLSVNTAKAQEDDKLKKLQEEIATYERELTRLRGQSSTLTNQIAQFDAQIKLTTLKIDETQKKIDLLSGRITQLETSLESLTEAFSERVVETYKMSKVNQPVLFLASAGDVKTAFMRYFYLMKIQESDHDLMIRLQSAQTTYQGEKTDQEDLQQELEKQKTALDGQKKAKANLLAATKNDEKKYQQLLSQARAEFEAIQAIIAGKGKEEEAGRVSKGQRIASVIQGASCNSSGSHLHFIVRSGNSALNPFSYLKSGIDYENCSGSGCGSGDGDSFSPSGSWDWPISPKITFSQGFGSTWATRNTWVGRVYSAHNGIDINSSNSEVRAVESGVLYRGSYGGSGGCRLRYVRVDHDNSDLDTLYLHINY